jgi:hypothetical protein
MTDDVKELSREALNLYLSIKNDTEKLKNLKKQILEKAGNNKKIIVDDNILKIYKHKRKFNYLLKKEFNNLPKEKQKELYRSGLLQVYFKINNEKYEKSKDLNLNFELDKFVNKKERPEKYINISLGKNTKEMLSSGDFNRDEYVHDLNGQIEYLEEQLEELEEYSEYRLVMDQWSDAYDDYIDHLDYN